MIIMTRRWYRRKVACTRAPPSDAIILSRTSWVVLPLVAKSVSMTVVNSALCEPLLTHVTAWPTVCPTGAAEPLPAGSGYQPARVQRVMCAVAARLGATRWKRAGCSCERRAGRRAVARHYQEPAPARHMGQLRNFVDRNRRCVEGPSHRGTEHSLGPMRTSGGTPSIADVGYAPVTDRAGVRGPDHRPAHGGGDVEAEPVRQVRAPPGARTRH
jgi:hypothetical protein